MEVRWECGIGDLHFEESRNSHGELKSKSEWLEDPGERVPGTRTDLRAWTGLSRYDIALQSRLVSE